MTKTNFEKVREFHEAFAPHLIAPSLSLPVSDVIDLRYELIREEVVDELKVALENQDFIEIADALGDILYVVYGAALTFGIDIDTVFAEIHRSNMTKLGLDGKPIYREDGKVLKGPNYEPPNIAKILGLS